GLFEMFLDFRCASIAKVDWSNLRIPLRLIIIVGSVRNFLFLFHIFRCGKNKVYDSIDLCEPVEPSEPGGPPPALSESPRRRIQEGHRRIPSHRTYGPRLKHAAEAAVPHEALAKHSTFPS